MFGIPEWALGVGVIIVSLFAGIGLLVRLLPSRMRQRQSNDRLQDQEGRLDEIERRLAEGDRLEQRVAEVEERLDFTERLFTRQREAERLAPPPA